MMRIVNIVTMMVTMMVMMVIMMVTIIILTTNKMRVTRMQRGLRTCLVSAVS